VFVERRIWGFWTPEAGDLPNEKIFTSEGTSRLDRDALERDGYAHSRNRFGGTGPTFYVSPEQLYEEHQPKTPDCLVQLGLKLPCTAGDVKQAYRRMAKQYHPDAGGEGQQFVTLQRNFEQALSLVGVQS
jgi:hypothetical protein